MGHEAREGIAGEDEALGLCVEGRAGEGTSRWEEGLSPSVSPFPELSGFCDWVQKFGDIRMSRLGKQQRRNPWEVPDFFQTCPLLSPSFGI